jgi:hypothetical protein
MEPLLRRLLLATVQWSIAAAFIMDFTIPTFTSSARNPKWYTSEANCLRNMRRLLRPLLLRFQWPVSLIIALPLPYVRKIHRAGIANEAEGDHLGSPNYAKHY